MCFLVSLGRETPIQLQPSSACTSTQHSGGSTAIRLRRSSVAGRLPPVTVATMSGARAYDIAGNSVQD